MRSVIGHRSIFVGSGFAIAAILLWIGALFAVHWLAPPSSNPNLIRIDEATYGENCENFVPSPGNINRVKRGNATVLAFQACNNTDVFCPVYVDHVRFGDPAVGCNKDFSISWRCGNDIEIRHLHIADESIQHLVWLSCPDHER